MFVFAVLSVVLKMMNEKKLYCTSWFQIVSYFSVVCRGYGDEGRLHHGTWSRASLYHEVSRRMFHSQYWENMTGGLIQYINLILQAQKTLKAASGSTDDHSVLFLSFCAIAKTFFFLPMLIFNIWRGYIMQVYTSKAVYKIYFVVWTNRICDI